MEELERGKGWRKGGVGLKGRAGALTKQRGVTGKRKRNEEVQKEARRRK